MRFEKNSPFGQVEEIGRRATWSIGHSGVMKGNTHSFTEIIESRMV